LVEIRLDKKNWIPKYYVIPQGGGRNSYIVGGPVSSGGACVGSRGTKGEVYGATMSKKIGDASGPGRYLVGEC